jgi:hypothetical protein
MQLEPLDFNKKILACELAPEGEHHRGLCPCMELVRFTRTDIL